MQSNLLSIGVRINHPGHGDGTIIGYNGQPKNEYTEQLGSEVIGELVKIGLAFAITNSNYDSNRYPYVIKFDSGYQDVYAPNEITEIA